MKSFFLKQFGIESTAVVSVSGNGANSALIHLLADEAIRKGYRPLVIANSLQKYPVEGKVLISDETELLLNLIRSDEPEITYLARKVDGDLLYPFSEEDIRNILKNLDHDVKVFVQHFHEGKELQKYGRILQAALTICTLNFNLLRPRLLDVYENTDIRSSSTAQKRIREEFLEMIREQCPAFEKSRSKKSRILFVDQVRNLLDENLFIPVARNMNDTPGSFKILYGHVHHYQLKEI